MAQVHKKRLRLAAIILLFCTAKMNAMDIVPAGQNRAERILQLKNLILKKIPPCGIVTKRASVFAQDKVPLIYMEFSPDGRYLVEAGNIFKAENIIITDSTTGKEHRCGKEAGSINAIACNNDYLVSGSNSDRHNNLFKWCLHTGQKLENFSRHLSELDYYTCAIDHIAIHPHTSDFVSISKLPGQERLFIHEGKTGEIRAHYNGNYPSSVCYSPSGDFFISTDDHPMFDNVVLCDGFTGESKKGYATSPYSAVAWNPDGRTFVMVSQKQNHTFVIVCNGATGEIIKAFKYQSESCCGTKNIKFSPDGNCCIIVSAGGFSSKNNVVVFDGKTFEIIGSICGNIKMETMDISHNSRYFIIGTNTQKDNIMLYDLKRWQLVTKFTSDSPCVIRWRPNSSQFVSLSSEKCNLTWWNLFNKQIKDALRDLKTAVDDSKVDFVVDVCNGVRPMDQEVYNVLPESVKLLLQRMLMLSVD